jgi:hypothetical protein
MLVRSVLLHCWAMFRLLMHTVRQSCPYPFSKRRRAEAVPDVEHRNGDPRAITHYRWLRQVFPSRRQWYDRFTTGLLNGESR